MSDVIRAWGRTPVEAWMRCVRELLNKGSLQKDGPQDIREICPFSVVVEDLAAPSDEQIPAPMRQRIHGEVAAFLDIKPIADKGWSYGQRILADGGDQLESARLLLARKPESKAATAVTLRPGRETASLPCLVSLDWKLRDGSLRTTAFFRSQDVFGKQLSNMLAIRGLTSTLATSLGVLIGPLTLFIASAHIYGRDVPEAEALVADLGEAPDVPRRQVLVIGKEKRLSLTDPLHRHALWCAEETGRLLAGRGMVVLTGGLGGIMESASRGVAQAGGVSVGLLPALTPSELAFRTVSRFQTAAIRTGLGDRERIPMLVRSANGVICISGGEGARREALLALELRLPVAVIAGTGGIADDLANQAHSAGPLFVAQTPAEAVAWVADEIENGREDQRDVEAC